MDLIAKGIILIFPWESFLFLANFIEFHVGELMESQSDGRDK